VNDIKAINFGPCDFFSFALFLSFISVVEACGALTLVSNARGIN